MDIPVSGADSWLTINGHSLSFHSEDDNLQVNAKESERNFIRITNQAPEDFEIWVDNEQLETERYGSWYWRPRSFAGLYRFTLVCHNRQTESTFVRVLPSRMSYERYEQMLGDIQSISEDLLFQLHSPSSERLSSQNQSYSSSALREYKLIKAVFPELADVVSHIRRNPHTQLTNHTQAEFIHQVKRFSSEVMPIPGPFIQLPVGVIAEEMTAVLPQLWMVEKHTLTHDNYENRLLKHFLWRQLLPRLISIQEKANSEIRKRRESQRIKRYQCWEDDEADKIQILEGVTSDCQNLIMRCIAWGSEIFLKDVQLVGQHQQPSQILQKHPYYNRFYRVFLRFQKELGVNLDADSYIAELSIRKLSEIYETWSVFIVTNAAMTILRKTGYQIISNNGFFTVQDDLFQFEVDRNAAVELLKGNRKIIIRYEPLYEPASKMIEGLVSRGQKQRTPDLSIELKEFNQIRCVLIFDAKYRTEKVGNAITFLDEDLNKMREYRDTIKLKIKNDPRLRSIVRSAYILYPGDVLEHDPNYSDIGALPLFPKMDKNQSARVGKVLSQVLKQIL
jgi:hypothetical protein